MTYVTQVDAVSAVSNYISDNIDSIYFMLKSSPESGKHELIKMFLHLFWDLPSIDTTPRIWIPVSESIPATGSIVLATVIRTDSTWNGNPYFRLVQFENHEWYPIPQLTLTSGPIMNSLKEYDGGDPVVTAWMPLPELYKENN